MTSKDLKIIITGAGIAGLSVAIALELAGFDYTILEQTPIQEHESDPNSELQTETNTIGGAVQVGPTALHFLRQLGVYEEIQKISKPVSGNSMNEHDMNFVGRIDMSTYRERYGYHTEVMAHSQLHTLLLQRVPPKRIIYKKVLGMIQDKNGVTIRCSDGATFEGDILIAADGSFSNVRHNLFWSLDEKKLLPKPDTLPMSIDMHVISGCTKPLDPMKYPVLLDAMSEIQSIQLPDKPYTVWFVPLLDNRIAWSITREVNKAPIRQGEASRVYQWRQEEFDSMLEAVKNSECPYGGEVGDLIETTPPECMYLYMSEERLCETWYGGRTVLVGDACHKGLFQPISEAIVDGVTLVNFLSNTTSYSLENLQNIFKDYQERRNAVAKSVVDHCAQMRQVFCGKGRGASLKRSVVFNYMPEKVRNLLDDKRNEDRPQLWFLPQVKDNGTVKPLPSIPPTTDNVTQEGAPSNTEAHVKVSLEAAVNAAANAISSTRTSANTSPRASRSSWNSYSRPTFSALSMSSASNVPLFPSSQATSKSTPKSSIVNSPRSSTSRSKEERESISDKTLSDDGVVTAAAAVLSKEATITFVSTEIDAVSSTVSPNEVESKTRDTNDLSDDDDEEFVNCLSTADDDKLVVDKGGASL
ncbi:hypothetical protein BGZ76_008785 [Entomortierella beljakovae]|nr:hypothetical protein BGZ76_008785 [Entomortierella beljakovae]